MRTKPRESPNDRIPKYEYKRHVIFTVRSSQSKYATVKTFSQFRNQSDRTRKKKIYLNCRKILVLKTLLLHLLSFLTPKIVSIYLNQKLKHQI